MPFKLVSLSSRHYLAILIWKHLNDHELTPLLIPNLYITRPKPCLFKISCIRNWKYYPLIYLFVPIFYMYQNFEKTYLFCNFFSIKLSCHSSHTQTLTFGEKWILNTQGQFHIFPLGENQSSCMWICAYGYTVKPWLRICIHCAVFRMRITVFEKKKQNEWRKFVVSRLSAGLNICITIGNKLGNHRVSIVFCIINFL